MIEISGSLDAAPPALAAPEPPGMAVGDLSVVVATAGTDSCDPAAAIVDPGTAVRDTGTAVRDTAVAVVAAAVLGAALAGRAGWSWAGAAGAVLGVVITGAAGGSLIARPGRWSGPADRVTLLRAVMIGGCATLGLLAATGGSSPRPWALFLLTVPTLALDAADGAVARRTGTASAAGRRLDGELDAALLMVLSIAAAPALGWWVLAIGLMRYVFWAAGKLRPRQRGYLAFSQFRRVVAALQGIMFAVALAPVVPLVLAQACVALALTLLVVSFGIDVVHLERHDLGSAGWSHDHSAPLRTTPGES